MWGLGSFGLLGRWGVSLHEVEVTRRFEDLGV